MNKGIKEVKCDENFIVKTAKRNIKIPFVCAQQNAM